MEKIMNSNLKLVWNSNWV
uniref:Uncharacterized protein n=1 Tax=Rhizophora mucronata TaxID=61149 RepID=A0A2P2NRS9_RHIMU